jgi:chitodextrinase
LRGLVYALAGKEQPYDVYRFSRGNTRYERPNHNPFADTDTAAPTTPGNLQAAAVSSTQVDLSWDASSDNVGVAGYRILRDSIELTTTTGLSYSDTTAAPSTSYIYQVTAFDAQANESAPTDPADGSVTTPA